MAYTNFEKVKQLLLVDAGKIRISDQEITPGSGQKEDISKATVEQFIIDMDAKINIELQNRGLKAADYTDALSLIATNLVAHRVYVAVYPRVGVNEIPAAVSGWKKEADDLLKEIGKGKIVGAVGDIDFAHTHECDED